MSLDIGARSIWLRRQGAPRPTSKEMRITCSPSEHMHCVVHSPREKSKQLMVGRWWSDGGRELLWGGEADGWGGGFVVGSFKRRKNFFCGGEKLGSGSHVAWLAFPNERRQAVKNSAANSRSCPFCTHHPLAEPQLSHFSFPSSVFFFPSPPPPPSSFLLLTSESLFLVHISVWAIMIGDNDRTHFFLSPNSQNQEQRQSNEIWRGPNNTKTKMTRNCAHGIPGNTPAVHT